MEKRTEIKHSYADIRKCAFYKKITRDTMR